MTTVATGLGGMLANKGAVVVRMRVYDTGLCFVAAHLASGESTAAHANRLKDIAEIIRRTEFPAESQDPVSDSSVLIYGSGSTQQV